MRQQHGFTLLELMVAMAIFAMLAVAGWQVFDGVNRARERAQFHADHLAVLQYAYLQLQQDMGQVIPYQAASTQQEGVASNRNIANADNGAQTNDIVPEPFMRLDGEHISFMRFADPDPRYQSSASIQRIEYVFVEDRLIRRQYTSLDGGRDSVSLDSVLLEGITAGRWQAYLPALSPKFPDENGSNNTDAPSGQAAGLGSAQPETALLPKGVALNFTYEDMPITWQWALTPPPIVRSTNQNAPNNVDNDNSNGDNGNDENNNSSNGFSDNANGNIENSD
ncbi:type II secretion system minor pseudopilin GspJ [Psychrobacter sp. B38]|uniref:type II secretion system minor pseudopilin GspJ n=1 Tax=Psychrobacter sp. B38 TaxID=3143538 RepID=UPI00320E487A